MFVSRPAELGMLDELLDGLRAGRGDSVLLRGNAGMGKSTLLDALAERCGDDITVLRARGVETEAGLAFSALRDLLSPCLDGFAVLPRHQSDALAAALALGPQVASGRLAVCVATLGLLQVAADSRPVVAVVDDLQWLDRPSRECVLYAARRMSGPVAVVLAVREPDAALERLGLRELRLEPLDRAASLALLAGAAPDLAPSVARVLADAAAGNPLALVELPGTLTPGQRAGTVGLELPIAPGTRLSAVFADRIDELDPPARRALLVAALHGGADLGTISAACARARSDVNRLEDAEVRGLVRIAAGTVAFAHPLVRGAVYHGSGPRERRQAHRALAGVLSGESRTWHLAAATLGCDEAVAVQLEAVAEVAVARRGFADAAAALEQAARLSAPRDVARRLLAAGEAAGAAGAADRALPLLREAADVARDPIVRGRAQHARGRIMGSNGQPVEAIALLLEGADAVDGRGRSLAAAMLADAANGCTAVHSYVRAEALARRAAGLLDDADDASVRAAVLAMLGWALVLRGKAPEACPVLAEAERLAEPFDPLGPSGSSQRLLLGARIPLGDFERARDGGLGLATRARDAGALATLGGGLIVAADAAMRLGDWRLADEATAEAERLAGQTGRDSWHVYALTTRARLAAARGREEEGRRAGGTALEIAEASGIRTGLGFVHGALGFVELSYAHVDDAVAELESCERLVDGSGHEEPTLVPWTPDLVEAYARSGRDADAHRVLAILERQAASTATAFPAAAAARCRGMLEEDFDPWFADALALHDVRPLPFERARTLLAYGRRLHRARRRALARDRLREALAGFDRLGATAWSTQAQHELRAAGARRRRASAARDGTLTPQEQRVAAAVCRGASNREVAAELFLTPKTVAFHLQQIYRKLGVRSRTQLAAKLSREATAPEVARGAPRS